MCWAIANRGQWDQGCSLFMATDLGPVRATHKKNKIKNLENQELPNPIVYQKSKFYLQN